MPIYDYACQNCGHVVEVIHGVHDTGPAVCPQCGGPMRKLLSRPAIHFKGSGWAKNDRVNRGQPVKAPTAGEKEGKSTDAQPASTETAKTDSKPAPTASSGDSTGGGKSATADGGKSGTA